MLSEETQEADLAINANAEPTIAGCRSIFRCQEFANTELSRFILSAQLFTGQAHSSDAETRFYISVECHRKCFSSSTLKKLS